MKSGGRHEPAVVRTVVVLIVAVCALLGSAGFSGPVPTAAAAVSRADVDDVGSVQIDDDAAPAGLRDVAAVVRNRIPAPAAAVLLWVVVAVASTGWWGRRSRPPAPSGRQRLGRFCIARC